MDINWKVRIKNKVFWLALIPAVLLLVQTVCALFGVSTEVQTLEARLLDLVNAVFAVLAILGIITDPTTDGLSDSKRALSYQSPWIDASIAEEPNEVGLSRRGRAAE